MRSQKENSISDGVAVNVYLRMLAASINVSDDPKLLPVRKRIRAVALASNRTYVSIDTEDPESEPRIVGSSGGYFTPGGDRVQHSSAYGRKCYRMQYRCSTKRVLVGALWACRNSNELVNFVMRRSL